MGDNKIRASQITLNAPEGFLLNGVISVVDTAGITVAIKTLAGNDPSASDPVKCRINGVIRSITSALSVAKADGTNWCNAGSSELATEEIDYFVYLGYNATDGVVIGFSRYPGANSYDDFSTTTTNEKYCAISTITNAAATDYYNVIGRFAATLSAGAGYTWSVPTFTAKNLIQRPIYETRWLEYVPQLSAYLSMTITSTSITLASYKLINDTLHCKLDFLGTIGGTPSSAVQFTVPFPRRSTVSFEFQGVGRAKSGGVWGLSLGNTSFASQTLFWIQKYDTSNYDSGDFEGLLSLFYEI